MISSCRGLPSLKNFGRILRVRAVMGAIVFVVVVTGLPFDPQIRSSQGDHGLHGLVDRALHALIDPIRPRTAHADDDEREDDRKRELRRIKRKLDAAIKLLEGIAAGGGGVGAALNQHDLNLGQHDQKFDQHELNLGQHDLDIKDRVNALEQRIQGDLNALDLRIQEVLDAIGAGGGDPSKLVFVTSSIHTGNLGGLDGGDAICNTRAAEAGLPGRYAAWLSDASGSPLTRFVRSKIPYVLVDRTTVVANDFTDLTDGSIGSITLDETGGVGGALTVWTGTQSGGNSTLTDCNGWNEGVNSAVTGDFGDREPIDFPTRWTLAGGTQCTGEKSLYCFQQ